MSKAALRDLAKLLGQSDPKKDFRNKVINPELHGFNFRETSIKAELIAELEEIRTSKNDKTRDSRIREFLTDADIGQAAREFRRVLSGYVSNPSTAIRALETDPNIIVGKFGTISTALKVASDAAVNVLRKKINEKTTDYVPFIGGEKLINLDHTRTVAETRIARDITQTKINPFDLISELRRNPTTSRKQFDEVYSNVLDIYSYYSNDGSKVFEIKGTVEKPVSGALRSGRANQLEGTNLVKARVKAFRDAVDAAIKDVNWVGQSASDSYIDSVLKTLNNAAVKAGGSGKIQKIDRTKSTAKNKATVKQKTSVRMISKPTKFSVKAPKQANSMLSLQRINNYINSKLPEAVRANMNEGTLVNRTGRFSESARMVGGGVTAQGYPSLAYTYQRAPYDVFDSTLGTAPWNTPGRDPRSIIEKSIRDIAREMAIGRFYLRRA